MNTSLTRRSFTGALSGGLAALTATGVLQGADRKPNIVFLLSDDLGLDIISAYGSDKYKTPNIDSLAASGVRFENCYAAPLCGPTRCLINTGRYAFRTGGISNQSWREGGPGAKSRDEYPLAKLMKEAGYATCSTGKWRQVGETPGDWGFDEWLTDPTAGGWFWEKSYTKNGKLIEHEKEVYCPDVAHDFAVDFIRRNKAKPFYLYYPTHLIHGPILRTPDSKPDSKDLYADNVAYLDKLVGKMIAEIDSLGLRQNTVIIFAGDNGTAQRSGTVRGRQINGAKGSMWEGGSRVPLIVNWKGKSPKNKVLPDLVDFTDYYSTFAELAGAKMPTSHIFDSRSFAPQLQGKKGKPRDWVYVHLGPNWYVKDQAWKLNQRAELYDMKQAPFEEKLIPADSTDPQAVAARKKLSGILAQLNPTGGKTDTGAGDGGKKGKKNKKKAA
ncbi:MAG: sulfatase-like hydrolase/transferase [Candidatus Solibacter usitatus]|nr:sulfatase-like hydrolase/transferase [Candidatus Solibacter usitatus]